MIQSIEWYNARTNVLILEVAHRYEFISYTNMQAMLPWKCNDR